MALHFGFYHSDDITGPRLYTAEDMSRLLDGIITEGVFGNFLETFNIVLYDEYKEYVLTDPTEKTPHFEINVGPGKAWYNGTWTMIDENELLPLGVEDGDLENNRVDELIIEVNKNTRMNRLFILKGDPGQELIIDPTTDVPAVPYAPEGSGYVQQHKRNTSEPLYDEPEEGIYWYPLSYIWVKKGLNSKTYNKNDIVVKKMAYDVVSCPIEHEDIRSLYTGWEKVWSDWFDDRKKEWNVWFNSTKTSWTNWFNDRKTEWTDWIASKNADWETWKTSTTANFYKWWDEFKEGLKDDIVFYLENKIDKNTEAINKNSEDIKVLVNAVFGEQYTYTRNNTTLTATKANNTYGTSVTAVFDETTSTLKLTSSATPKTNNIRFEVSGEDLIIK